MRNDTVKQGCPLLFSGIVCYRVCHCRPIGPDSDCSLNDKRKERSKATGMYTSCFEVFLSLFPPL